ncbi:MAG: D-alanyl-D-alanine carboxypeptidase/D-alanyl-D-alanine-endopeptidase [Ottowia sp.]|nr:D-alanyl-D-alanine carboxypeptidase/D-alanyl-D-alanine-endopeptidase [Ottowia sp.]
MTMPHHRLFFAIWIGIVCTACTVLPINTESAARERLKNTLDLILADAQLEGATTGIVVRDVTQGHTLYARNEKQRLVPASTMKLLTSAAAFDILGDEHRFETQVLITGAQKEEVLHGDVYVRGTGDPTLHLRDYEAFAAAIAKRGIRFVEGNIVIDDTWFDTQRLGQDWAHDDESAYYAAQVSAVNISPDTDYYPGTVLVSIAPAKTKEAPAIVSMVPPNHYLTIASQAKTMREGAVNSLVLQRKHGTNEIVISGGLAVDAMPVRLISSVWEPSQYVAHLFAQALHTYDVKVKGQVLVGVSAPSDAIAITTHYSSPLSQLAIPWMKRSNNVVSEMYLKSLGRKQTNEGTWDAGRAAVADFLRRQHIDTTVLYQADGSGLSRRNLLSAWTVSDLLLKVRDQPWFDTWYKTLPVAGNPDISIGGTLHRRMRGTAAENNVRAKTGSLSAVSSLCGYVKAANGRVLVFSIFFNNYLNVPIKSVEDKIAVALATWQ